MNKQEISDDVIYKAISWFDNNLDYPYANDVVEMIAGNKQQIAFSSTYKYNNGNAITKEWILSNKSMSDKSIEFVDGYFITKQ